MLSSITTSMILDMGGQYGVAERLHQRCGPTYFNAAPAILRPVLATSEVIPSRAMRALEGEGGRLSHLEVAARGGVVVSASQ